MKSKFLAGVDVKGRLVVSGALLFKMKDTHGLPMEVVIDKIISDGMRIAWPDYIDEARKHGRLDFQSMEDIENGLRDSDWSRQEIPEILQRIKHYIMENKLCHS